MTRFLRRFASHRLSPLALPLAAAGILHALGFSANDGLAMLAAVVGIALFGGWFKVGFAPPPAKPRNLRVV